MSRPGKVAIVGAGITGLATAYYLRQAARSVEFDLDISLIEASERPGGVIQSERIQQHLFEWGPENFVAFRPLILDLIEEIGLGNEVIGSNDRIRQTFVVHEGRLQPLPEGMAFLSPVNLRAFWSTRLISTGGKLRACVEPLIRPSRGDLSVYEFLNRRLGKELTERIAEPLVSAIYGGDIRRLSLASALPETYHMEQRYGSLWKGMRARGRHSGSNSQPFFRSLRRGMSTLVEGLMGQLSDISLYFGCPVTRISHDSAGFHLESRNLDAPFDAIVVCAAAPSAASMLESLSDTAAGLLRDIDYTQTWIVYLAYARQEFSHPLDGFGFVVPQSEAQVLDACTWVSSKFEGRSPKDSVLLRCAIHNGRQERDPASEEETVERVSLELSRILGISAKPRLARARQAPGGMAQPAVQHGTRLDAIRSELGSFPGLYLSAAYVSGVGVPSCIAHGQLTAQRVFKFLAEKHRPGA